MRREDYEHRMTNEQIAQAVARFENFSQILSDAGKALKLFAEVGRETIATRQSVKRARTPLDLGEFMAELKRRHPEAAERLKEAKVLKFELGRMHLRFPDDDKKAQFGLYRHSVESLSEDLYKIPCKIMVKASPMPYEDEF